MKLIGQLLSTSIVLSMGFFFSGCAALSERSFIETMEKDTDGFFVANRDFPTVSGDSGSAYRSRKDIRLRTPATAKNKEKYDYQNALQEELDRLEEQQNDRAFHHYLRFKEKMPTVSERIYFLRLNNLRARDQYLFGKGLLGTHGPGPEEREAIRNRDILLGMSKDSVVESWGRPMRVDVAGNPKYENERWAFHRAGRVHYIYFEGGRVQGWTQ